MYLSDIIRNAYPELEDKNFEPGHPEQKILLFDDGDGVAYIKRWDYEKPIPEGLKLGK